MSGAQTTVAPANIAPPKVMGTETRTEILPKVDVDSQAEFDIPNYDFSENVPTPDQVGVSRQGSLAGVVDAARAVPYYVDMIGYGTKSSPFTSDRVPVYKMGINYFMRTGMQCPNGADMWKYVQGIPKGDMFGRKIGAALAMQGLTLQGLAPGIIEDVQDAMNPRPLLQSVFGNVYPQCKEVTLPVGDSFGRTGDGTDEWVKGKFDYYPGTMIPRQTKWVQQTDRKGNPMFISKEQFDATPKTHNPDGTLKAVTKEGFANVDRASVIVAIALLSAAFAVSCSQ
jgi:hypothetical protein